MPNPTAENNLETLYASLKQQFQNANQPALLDALNNVNQYTAMLRRPDRYKRIPYVTQENKQELMRLHERVAEESEKLLKSTNNKHVKDILEKIFSLSSRNFTNISGYDPSVKPKSVDTIDEEVRALHLDMGNSKTRKVGKTLSERKLISFLDEKGNKIGGVFTPKSKDDVYTKIWSYLTDNARGNGRAGDMVNSLLMNAGDGIKLPEDTVLKTENYKQLYGMMSNITKYNEENQAYEVDLDKMTAFLAKLNNTTTNKVITTVGADKLEEIRDYLDQFGTQVMANMRVAGISDDSRIDTRNAAMSAAADLFGVPNLVARSRPMTLTVRDEKGNPVELEGTFMVEAKGVDLNNLRTDPDRLTADSIQGTDGKAFRDLADLQVLDFICGNVDRHMANIFYQIDNNGKLIGIQGIDNDCSFGEFVPEKGESRRRMAGLDNMRVMSESMANKVMAMKGPTLKYALRGYGLTEGQLDAACKRLEKIQDAVQKSLDNPVEEYKKDGSPVFKQGQIRILKDDEFKKVKLQDLVVKTDEKGKEDPKAKEDGNIFACAYKGIAVKEARPNPGTNYELRGDEILNTGNRCRQSGLESAKQKASSAYNTLDSNSTLFHSSGKYRDMERAAKNLAKYQQKIFNRVSLANQAAKTNPTDLKNKLNGIVKPSELKKMAQLSEKLANAAERYLRYKGITEVGEKHKDLKDYSTYTQGRIKAAQSALAFANNFKTVKPEEADLSRVSERQLKEEIARVAGDAKDPAARNQPKIVAEPPKALS